MAEQGKIAAVFGALQGRTTTFLVFFALVGTVFHWFHRLDSTYIGFMTVVMTFVLGHSIKDDVSAANGIGPDAVKQVQQ